MKRGAFFLFVFSVFVLGTLPGAVRAEVTVAIQGNQRIEAQTIQSYMVLPQTGELDALDIDASLKRLYSTGLFSDVQIVREGDVITVKVKENPIINEVVFEGNKRIDDDELAKEVSLQPRAVYTRAKVQNDVGRLINVYQKNGRFSVMIEPKVIQLDQNRLNLVFEINEGAKSTIKKIIFVGNEAFSSRTLEKVVQTKEERWYRFFSDDDTYDQDRVAFDKESLRKHYISNGYADFKVNSAIAEITPDKQGFILTFSLTEGDKYHFGDITIDSSLKDVNPDVLREQAATITGETFNAELIEKSIELMTEKLSELGYAFVDVDTQFKRDADANTMGVTYAIQEGPKVYVEKINIHGNLRTLDRVVRREFRIAEGDPYNAAKIRRSEQRIRNLGFFERVEVDTDHGSAPDKAVIDVEVGEQSTGELNFGAGFSTTDGALANISIRERNLLGRGQDLRFNLQRATKGLEADISFTEPYFMGKDVAVGFDLFKITRDRESESSFDSDSTGITLRGGYSLTEHLRHSVRYSFRNDDISNIEPDASRFVKDQEGTNSTSLIGHTFMYDTRDSRFEPTHGYYLRYNQDLAGLGGDSRFFRNELRGAYFKPVFFEELILRLSGKLGHVVGYGSKEVRINERFFIGGSDIRGFKNAGIGPRDSTTNDALGGNLYYVGSAEVGFPLGLPEELGFKGAAFIDAGSLTSVDDSGSEVLDTGSIRAGAGVGLSWRSPLGPIRIDVASPFIKESHDREQQVRFNFGTRF